MKNNIEKLYKASGYLSGFCIITIVLIILAQIIGRLLGFIVPSAEDFSGYALAASTFFGLAYTFRQGGHIRVTLLIQHLPEKLRYFQELFILVGALLLMVFLTYSCAYMVWESYDFEEVSYGYIAIPLWIPQLPMAIGALAFTLAIFHSLVELLTGKTLSYREHENELEEM